MKITLNIRNLRKEVDMTQAGLAKLMNCPQSQISRWETGGRKPCFDSLHRLSDALCCSVSDLCEISDALD